MADVMEQTISVPEAAERLGITTAEAYALVFARTLQTVESPSGRRVVPLEALEALRRQREAEREPA
jgi:hypothetical protein